MHTLSVANVRILDPIPYLTCGNPTPTLASMNKERPNPKGALSLDLKITRSKQWAQSVPWFVTLSELIASVDRLGPHPILIRLCVLWLASLSDPGPRLESQAGRLSLETWTHGDHNSFDFTGQSAHAVLIWQIVVSHHIFLRLRIPNCLCDENTNSSTLNYFLVIKHHDPYSQSDVCMYNSILCTLNAALRIVASTCCGLKCSAL